MSDTGSATIRPVESRAEIDLFHAAGLAAAAGHPLWVPPSRYELHQIFAAGSPIMRENAVRAFVALDAGRPVGRVAAIVHRARLAKYGEPVGHFGYLEAPDRPEIFDALLGTAEGWLRAQGMQRVEGPYSLTINHEAGLLVDGFDVPPFIRTNWSPPHYATHLARRGYAPAMDLLAYAGNPAASDYSERVRAVLGRSREAASIRTEGLSALDWQAGGRRVNAFYNDAWAANWGSVPVSEAEADFIGRLSRPIVHPSWIRTAHLGDEPVALVGHIPDANEHAPRDGELFPLGWARLLGGLHLGRTRRSRLAMIGVASRFRGTRVGALAISKLLAEALETARRARIEEVEISWMLETNQAVLNLCRQLGAVPTRRFRIYTRDLAA